MSPGLSIWLNAPPSAVTVWVVLSLFVQVTLVPTVTVKLCGLKAKLAMETLFPPLVGAVVEVAIGAVVGTAVEVAVVGTPVGVEVLVVGEGPPHAATMSTRPITDTQSHRFVILVVTDFNISFFLLRFRILSIAFSAPLTSPSTVKYETQLQPQRFIVVFRWRGGAQSLFDRCGSQATVNT